MLYDAELSKGEALIFWLFVAPMIIFVAGVIVYILITNPNL